MGATVFLIDSELAVLHEVLEDHRRRLLLEIAHTDHRSMRDGLKTRESVLQSILQKLQPAPTLSPESQRTATPYPVTVTD